MRITYALTVTWLVILNVALGVVVGEAGPALYGASLCAVGLVISALYADVAVLLPRGHPLETWERATLFRGLVGLVATGTGIVAVGLATSGLPPRWLLYAGVVLALAAGGFALRVLMRV